MEKYTLTFAGLEIIQIRVKEVLKIIEKISL